MHLLADDQLRDSLDTQMVTNEEIDQAGLAIVNAEKAWGFSKGILDALARCQRVLLSPWRATLPPESFALICRIVCVLQDKSVGH
jgi:hypothetical protein